MRAAFLFPHFYNLVDMARDAELITKRNAKMRADFNRLKCEEVRCVIQGEGVYLKLSSDQVVKILSERYHLRPKQVENILYSTEPTAAPLTSAATF